MTKERWLQLMDSETEELTDEERKQGWHFCLEYDGLLIGAEMMEWGDCPQRCLCGVTKE